MWFQIFSFQFTFGIDDDGIVIDDVELPKWASSPAEFVMLHRAVSSIHSFLYQIHFSFFFSFFFCFTFLPAQHLRIFKNLTVKRKISPGDFCSSRGRHEGLWLWSSVDLFLSTYNLHFRLWNQSTFLLICTNGSTLYLDLNRKVGSIHLSKSSLRANRSGGAAAV